MKRQTRRMKTQLAVIGTGLAGFAASIFALNRGLDVAQFGHTGAIAYTTGYLDLYGVQGQERLHDPWSGLDRLRRSQPRHPLGLLSNQDIGTGFGQFTTALGEMGLEYTSPGAGNLSALLPYGVTKPTLSVPQTMRPGIEALHKGAGTLIVDFDGLQGFSAKEFQVNLATAWPGLRTARLTFPGMENRQVFPEVMARSLETREAREKLADLIRPRLNGEDYVGLPAMLGMHAPDATLAKMEDLIGAKLFEIPTIPPAVPGIRLREMFERALPVRGLKLEPQLKVSGVELGKSGATLFLQGAMEDLEVEAEAVVLATGRFLSGGLSSDRDRLTETLLGLPLSQPGNRDDWFRQEYLDQRGHPINRVGIEIDTSFRPTGSGTKPHNERLFAAGAVLAHQDWVRERCGAGLAIATAYGAVQNASQMLA